MTCRSVGKGEGLSDVTQKYSVFHSNEIAGRNVSYRNINVFMQQIPPWGSPALPCYLWARTIIIKKDAKIKVYFQRRRNVIVTSLYIHHSLVAGIEPLVIVTHST